jgi:hypothetical protein
VRREDTEAACKTLRGPGASSSGKGHGLHRAARARGPMHSRTLEEWLVTLSDSSFRTFATRKSALNLSVSSGLQRASVAPPLTSRTMPVMNSFLATIGYISPTRALLRQKGIPKTDEGIGLTASYLAG